jgi:hypothetical protein
MTRKSPSESRIHKLTRPVTMTIVDGAVIVTSPSTGQVFTANPSARVIVEALAKGATRADLVRLLSEKFRTKSQGPLDEGQLVLDVDECLFFLANEGLIDHAAL